MTTPIDPFFINIRIETDFKHHRHKAKNKAINEAKRLAQTCPGGTFMVFAPVAAFRYDGLRKIPISTVDVKSLVVDDKGNPIDTEILLTEDDLPF